MIRCIARLVAGVIVIFTSFMAAQASDDTWILPVTGFWNNLPPLTPPLPPYIPGQNTWWSNFQPPAIGDSATFNSDGTYSVLLNSSQTGLLYLAFQAGDVTIVGGGVPTLIVSNGASPHATVTGANTTLSLGNGAGAAANLSIGSGGLFVTNGAKLNALFGSQISTPGVIEIGVGGGGSGTINVQGAGSSLSQSGPSGITVGSATGAAALNIGTTLSGATVTTSAGGLTINNTGTANIGSASTTGTLNVNGNITIDGGTLNRFSSTGFNLSGNSMVTAQNNAQINFTGHYAVNEYSQFTLNSGADLLLTEYLDIGSNFDSGMGDGTVTVDGAGSSLTSSSSYNVNNFTDIGRGRTGSLTLRNGASGSFPSGIHLAGSQTGGVGNGRLNVLSGATLSVRDLFVGTGGKAGEQSLVAVDGPGSTITQTGNAVLRLGASGSLSDFALLLVQNGGTFNGGTGGTQIDDRGALQVAGGTFNTYQLTVNGSVEFKSGTLAINGSYTQSAGSLLAVDLENTLNIERLVATGDAVLHGTLEISLINGFQPILGNVFKVLHADGGIVGSFDQLSLPPLPSSLAWNVVYDNIAHDVLLQVKAGIIYGDMDSDGDVDGADFVAWQTHFPTSSGATLATGDADGDGDVDGADFVIWQTHFPYPPSPGVAPVPEPAAWSLALMALGGLLVRRRPELKL